MPPEGPAADLTYIQSPKDALEEVIRIAIRERVFSEEEARPLRTGDPTDVDCARLADP
jgi:hypothetical protein